MSTSRLQPQLLRKTIQEVHKAISNNDLDITSLCRNSLQVVEDTRHLNAFITTCQDEAVKKAEDLDRHLLDKTAVLEDSLYGIPISIKDSFCIESVLTTCGSRMLHNFIPQYTATAVKKLLESKSIIIGKTNMDEFAMGSSSMTSYYGPCANQFNSTTLVGKSPETFSDCPNWYLAGGSSTGSAVSVSIGACFASLGTDTGGSTRQPASWTGVVGFKPTYGLISRYGLIPLAHCMDVVSILARRVEDVETVFSTIVGEDDNDLTTVDHKQELKSPIRLQSRYSEKIKIRIGVPRRFMERTDVSTQVSNRFDEIVSVASNVNITDNFEIEFKDIDLPHSYLASECYTIISSAEIASNMSCYDGVKYGFASTLNSQDDFNRDNFFMKNRDLAFGSEVKKRILLGNYFLMEGNKEKYLVQAQKLRNMIKTEFDRIFCEQSIDIILMPSTPTTSVPLKTWLNKQEQNRLFYEDYFLIPANLANVPSISLPCGLSAENLPIGVQLVGSRYHDLDLLTVSKLFQDHILPRFGQYTYQ